jgi:hypothetical protein
MDNYDAEAFISEKLSSKLKEGEKIMWCGCTVKGSTMYERGYSLPKLIFMLIWTLAAAGLMVFLLKNAVHEPIDVFWILLFSLLFITVGVLNIRKMIFGNQEFYAVTNEKFYRLSSKGFLTASVMLNSFYIVSYKEYSPERGYVKITLKRLTRKSDRKLIFIRGIDNPHSVYDIIMANKRD